QAEDAIRDGHVTGVQTCALPTSALPVTPSADVSMFSTPPVRPRRIPRRMVAPATTATNRPYLAATASIIPRRVSGGNMRNAGNKIGRASCREGVVALLVVAALCR